MKQEPSILAKGEILINNNRVEANILLDTAAECNIISQRYVVENDIPAFESELL
ncbi:MAG: hypothetical protein AVDCRST_MAG95-2333 [uncultured Adhaeribacter sp.]|uniref:Peptidase A2 domain-containing protein n=1 Tax=uncultured Adhaeribacter sp. TaxID=448109 RepID=A0A6J4IWZ5_9BACT|nr:MAG: hypothetical protein AVDCRST_MAG95-2333 [uncultured Adhaeribacter sp.]